GVRQRRLRAAAPAAAHGRRRLPGPQERPRLLRVLGILRTQEADSRKDMHTVAANRMARPRGRAAWAGIIGAAGLAAVAALPIVTGSAASPVAPTFTRHTVDANLAGGEPLVTYYTNPTNGPDLAY